MVSYLPLLGKVAIVTGASRGIGTGLALELASRGAKVSVDYHGMRENWYFSTKALIGGSRDRTSRDLKKVKKHPDSLQVIGHTAILVEDLPNFR